MRLGPIEPMKKLFRLFTLAMMAVALCNCGDGDGPDNGPVPPGPNDGDPGQEVAVSVANMAGEWELTAWSPSSSFPDATHTVYLKIEGNNFTTYQVNVNGVGVVAYTGSFELSGSTLSGKYSDNTAWGSTYEVAEMRENQMIWQATGTDEKSTYFRTEIPEDVLNRAEAGTRAGVNDVRFL